MLIAVAEVVVVLEYLAVVLVVAVITVGITRATVVAKLVTCFSSKMPEANARRGFTIACTTTRTEWW